MAASKRPDRVGAAHRDRRRYRERLVAGGPEAWMGEDDDPATATITELDGEAAMKRSSQAAARTGQTRRPYALPWMGPPAT